MEKQFLRQCFPTFCVPVNDSENVTEAQILIQGLGWGLRLFVSNKLILMLHSLS